MTRPPSEAGIAKFVRGPFGWAPLLAVVAAFGAVLLAEALSMARVQLPGASVLFWVALGLPVPPIVAVLLRNDRPRRERIALVLLLGIVMQWPVILRSPDSFSGYDVLLHLRSLDDILRTNHLFQPNPLLTVSPYFPGLEAVTAPVAQLSGADPYGAGIVVLGFVRLIFSAALFLLFEEASGSSRVAGIAAVVYMLNPSFAFFDSVFSYESLALPLVVVVLLATARWTRRDRRSSRWLGLIIALLILTVVMTHHVTSYEMAGLLIGWAILHLVLSRRDPYGAGIVGVALVAAAGVVVWLFAIASLTLGYLVPPLAAAVNQAIRLVTEGEARQLFQSATGTVAPLWERFTGIAATFILAAWLPVGLAASWTKLRWNSLAVLLAIVALGFPASMVMRLTPTGSEAAGRSSAVVFLGLSFVVALGIVSLGDLIASISSVRRFPERLRLRTGRLRAAQAPWRAVAVAGFAILTIGGVILGTSPETRLPGPYLVGADSRSIDQESIQAAEWMRDTLGEERRVAADRVNRLLLGSYGSQDVVFHASTGIETWQLFLSPGVGRNEIARIKRAKLEFLLIDRRLSRSLPLVPFYYEEGEIAHERHDVPIQAATLAKWDTAPGVDRIFDSGDLQLYDVRSLSGTP
jgi:hypothetical protein